MDCDESHQVDSLTR